MRAYEAVEGCAVCWWANQKAGVDGPPAHSFNGLFRCSVDGVGDMATSGLFGICREMPQYIVVINQRLYWGRPSANSVRAIIESSRHSNSERRDYRTRNQV